MEKYFGIVVDAQNDFMNSKGSLYIPNAEQVILNINYWLSQQKPDECAGVLFTYDTHFKDSYATTAEAKQFPPHCFFGTEGWDLAVEPTLLNKEIPVFTLRKNVFDMWQQNDLFVVEQADSLFQRAVIMHSRDAFFNHLRLEGNGRIPHDQANAGERLPLTKLKILGVAADVCVSFAIKGAKERGFDIDVPGGTTAGINKTIEVVLKEFGISV